MLKDPSKLKSNRRYAVLKLVIGAELAMLVLGLSWFEKMKNSQDYRHVWYKRYPKAVDGYYWAMSGVAPKQREGDLLAWGEPSDKKL